MNTNIWQELQCTARLLELQCTAWLLELQCTARLLELQCTAQLLELQCTAQLLKHYQVLLITLLATNPDVMHGLCAMTKY